MRIRPSGLRAAAAAFDARFPIALKLALPLIVVSVLGTAVTAWALYRIEAEELRSDFREHARLMTGAIQAGLQSSSEASVDDELAQQIQRTLDALAMADPSIALVSVSGMVDGEPTVLASSDRTLVGARDPEFASVIAADLSLTSSSIALVEEDVNDQRLLHATAPVRIGGQPSLSLDIYFSTAKRDQELAALLRTFVIGATATVVGVLAVLFLTYRLLIFSRLRRLLQATTRMEAGEYDARVEGLAEAHARDEMVRLAYHFNRMAASLQGLLARLEAEATTDPLTGLYNRRYVTEVLEREVQRARRTRQPLAVVMTDIDNFKALNDTRGHACGDVVLQLVALALRQAVRDGDVVARFGGDEFVAVLPSCSPEALTAVLRRLVHQVRLATRDQRCGGLLIHASISSGGAILRPGETAESLLHRADMALLDAKQQGRDRICVAA